MGWISCRWVENTSNSRKVLHGNDWQVQKRLNEGNLMLELPRKILVVEKGLQAKWAKMGKVQKKGREAAIRDSTLGLFICLLACKEYTH